MAMGCLDILPSQLVNVKKLPVDHLMDNGFNPIRGLNIEAKNLDKSSMVNSENNIPLNIGASELVTAGDEVVDYGRFSTLREYELTRCTTAQIVIRGLKKNTPHLR